MGFFRVRVQEVTEYFVVAFGDSQNAAEQVALQFKAATTPAAVVSAARTPTPIAYNKIATTSLNDPGNNFSQQYARNIAGQAQNNLDNIITASTNLVTLTEFYLLQENINALNDTISVILS